MRIDIEIWDRYISFLSKNIPQNSPISFSFANLSEELNVSLDEIKNLCAIFLSAQKLSRDSHDKVKTLISGDEVVFTKQFDAPEIVALKVEEYQNISDIVYLFKNIRKGRGFESSLDSDNPIIEKIRQLNTKFSFLFRRLNGFIYPTEVCYKLGIEAMSLKRSNQIPDKLSVLNYQFVVKR